MGVDIGGVTLEGVTRGESKGGGVTAMAAVGGKLSSAAEGPDATKLACPSAVAASPRLARSWVISARSAPASRGL